jgi:hypothetical protein
VAGYCFFKGLDYRTGIVETKEINDLKLEDDSDDESDEELEDNKG